MSGIAEQEEFDTKTGQYAPESEPTQESSEGK